MTSINLITYSHRVLTNPDVRFQYRTGSRKWLVSIYNGGELICTGLHEEMSEATRIAFETLKGEIENEWNGGKQNES